MYQLTKGIFVEELENITNEEESSTKPEEKLSPREVANDLFRILFFSGLIIGLDQWTKYLIVKNMAFLERWLPESLAWLEPYARIVHWHNSGAAFGMFQNGNAVIMVLAVVASLFILYYFPQIDKKEWPLRIAMILQFAGAVGNLIDRFQYGYVIDFISVMDFPVFNIADSSITVGVTVLVIGIIIEEIKERKRKTSEPDTKNDENPQFEESNA